MSSKYRNILGSFGKSIEESCGSRKRLDGCDVADDVLHIPLVRIVPDPRQPRREFDEEDLYRLAGSLKSNGQLQPIRVRYDEEADSYVLISGERRWRAAHIAKMQTLQCVVDDRDIDVLTAQLAENLSRSDLSPIEQAHAFRELIDLHEWTNKQLADHIGVSESKVCRSLALLTLPEETQAKIDSGEIKGAAARELTKKREKSTKRAKPTVFTCRTSNGAKVEVTFRRTVGEDQVLAALQNAVDQISGQLRDAA